MPAEFDVIVIGGGAAGMIASWRAATLGAKVLLLEKTKRLGTKILISGGGKCNIVHDGDLSQVLKAFRKNEAVFLRPACYRFTNKQIVELFTSKMLEVYTRPDGRIFPVHGTAKDVVALLEEYVRQAGVRVQLETSVESILVESGSISGVVANGQNLLTKHLILATGGSSYPATGTTGDGWPWVKKMGHQVVRVHAALAPIYIELEQERIELSGIALRDCILKARMGGKEFVRWREDLLFTHKGISGPNALGISREIAELPQSSPVTLEVDVLPDKSFEVVSEMFDKWAQANQQRKLTTFVEQFMPARVAALLIKDAGLSSETTPFHLPKKNKNLLITMLKGWPLGEVKHVPLEKGEVVAGGIHLDEVDPKTMASKLVTGLYLCGEVLDIAGPVGGYNLQAAFSTGYVAGESAATASLRESGL